MTKEELKAIAQRNKSRKTFKSMLKGWPLYSLAGGKGISSKEYPNGPLLRTDPSRPAYFNTAMCEAVAGTTNTQAESDIDKLLAYITALETTLAER
jgi:hypothetical protein